MKLCIRVTFLLFITISTVVSCNRVSTEQKAVPTQAFETAVSVVNTAFVDTQLAITLSTPTGNLLEEDCLPPIVTFEYEAGLFDSRSGVDEQDAVLPPMNWQPQSKFPGKDSFHQYGGRILYRPSGEIWFYDLSRDYRIFRYKINANGWEKYKSVSNLSPLIPDRLFVSHDNLLWGIGYELKNYTSDMTGEIVPLLSLYDDNTNSFNFVSDIDSILVAKLNYYDLSTVRAVKEDQYGIFWFIFGEDNSPSLYKFEPNSRKAEVAVSLPPGGDYEDIEIMPDGSIWILDINREEILLRYYPETKELSPYAGTFSYADGEDLFDEKFFYGSYLYMDRKDQLWIDDRGWLENPSAEIPKRPIWHRVIRSPLFIELYTDGPSLYHWTRPFSMYHSSNDMYWFSSNAGIVRLNPQIGEWCLFTNYTSQVIEDESQNLWIVVNGVLYKYQLSDMK